MGFVVKGREIIYGFEEKKLARLQPNFIYVLTVETTSKCWEGKAHYYCTVLYCTVLYCTVNSDTKSYVYWTVHHLDS